MKEKTQHILLISILIVSLAIIFSLAAFSYNIRMSDKENCNNEYEAGYCMALKNISGKQEPVCVKEYIIKEEYKCSDNGESYRRGWNDFFYGIHK